MQSNQFQLFPRQGRHLLAATMAGALIAALPLTAAVAAPADSLLAQAAAPSEAAAAAFKRADKNGDGKLSKEEADSMPAVAANFTALDKDKDGSLSMEEFAAGMASKS